MRHLKQFRGRPQPHRGFRCGRTGKCCFNNERHALQRATELDPATLIRAYRCDFCGAWHLTSKRKA